jgi:hypothetical protein
MDGPMTVTAIFHPVISSTPATWFRFLLAKELIR